jgi:hypothetical protein
MPCFVDWQKMMLNLTSYWSVQKSGEIFRFNKITVYLLRLHLRKIIYLHLSYVAWLAS